MSLVTRFLSRMNVSLQCVNANAPRYQSLSWHRSVTISISP